MQKYELTIVTDPEKTEEELLNVQKTVESLIEKSNGSIISVDIQGKRKLAYRIKRHQYGQYILLVFHLTRDRAQELEKSLNLEQDIIRFLIIKAEEFQKLKPKSEQRREKEEPKREVRKPIEEKTEVRTPIEKTVEEKPKEPIKEKTDVEPLEEKEEPTTEKRIQTDISEPKEKEKKEKTKLKDLDKELDKILKDEIV